MSKHFMSTLMSELIAKNVSSPNSFHRVSIKKATTTRPDPKEFLYVTNVKRRYRKLIGLFEFIFDLLPFELREIFYNVMAVVCQKCNEFDKSRNHLAWYQYLGRLGITPSMIYFTRLLFCLGGLVRLYRASKRNCMVLVGCAYPALGTISTLSSSNPKDQHHWLTYWLLYATTQGLDCGMQWMIPFFPLYYPFKIVFLTWAQHPSTQGAHYLYRMLFSQELPFNHPPSKLDDSNKPLNLLPDPSIPLNPYSEYSVDSQTRLNSSSFTTDFSSLSSNVEDNVWSNDPASTS